MIKTIHAAQFNAVIELRGELPNKTLYGFFPYERVTELRDGVNEIFLRGVFERSLQKDVTRYLMFNHNPDQMIASTKDGLNITETTQGLRFETKLNEDSQYRNLNTEEYGVSVGFKAAEDGLFAKRGRNGTLSMIREAELYEISIVDNPAYKGTKIEMRTDQNKKKRLTWI